MINFEKLHKSYSLFCFYKLGCSIIKLSLTDLFTTERLAYMKEIFLMWRRHSCASVVKMALVDCKCMQKKNSLKVSGNFCLVSLNLWFNFERKSFLNMDFIPKMLYLIYMKRLYSLANRRGCIYRWQGFVP